MACAVCGDNGKCERIDRREMTSFCGSPDVPKNAD